MSEEAAFDALVAAVENPAWSSSRRGPKTLSVLAAEEQGLIELGLLEPGEPTKYRHALEQRRLRGEFTAKERMEIRLLLGLLSQPEEVQDG